MVEEKMSCCVFVVFFGVCMEVLFRKTSGVVGTMNVDTALHSLRYYS